MELSVVSMTKAAEQSSISTSSCTAHSSWRVMIVEVDASSSCGCGCVLGAEYGYEGMLTPTVSMSPDCGMICLERGLCDEYGVAGVAVEVGAMIGDATEKKAGETCAVSIEAEVTVAVAVDVTELDGDDEAGCTSVFLFDERVELSRL